MVHFKFYLIDFIYLYLYCKQEKINENGHIVHTSLYSTTTTMFKSYRNLLLAQLLG